MIYDEKSQNFKLNIQGKILIFNHIIFVMKKIPHKTVELSSFDDEKS